VPRRFGSPFVQGLRGSMANRCLGFLRPRVSARARARELVAVLGASALLVGCTTTHTLGRIDDDGVRPKLDALAASGDAIVRVRGLPGAHPPLFGERVTGVTPPGLIVEPTRGQPLLVARDQVTSLSRYDHARGAVDGAIGGSIAGFVLGLTIGLLQSVGGSGCTDGCGTDPDPVAVGLRAAALLGAVGVVFGAGLGAAGGHEERFEISP
jgi:hypothetical protein